MSDAYQAPAADAYRNIFLIAFSSMHYTNCIFIHFLNKKTCFVLEIQRCDAWVVNTHLISFFYSFLVHCASVPKKFHNKLNENLTDIFWQINNILFYTCSEKWRPKPVIPATSLKVEGEVTRKTSSTTEHYPAKPYSRQAPTPRQANLSLSKEDISMSTETTYRKNSATVLGSPLKRALRYDPVFRKHDNIDWM